METVVEDRRQVKHVVAIDVPVCDIVWFASVSVQPLYELTFSQPHSHLSSKSARYQYIDGRILAFSPA
jgi:hypothetical protein